MNKRLDEFNNYEIENEVTLPNWYKGWCLANKVSMEQRPVEYVHVAMIARVNLLRILNNREWFVMADPEKVY